MKKSQAILAAVLFAVVLAVVTVIDFIGVDGMGKYAASDITLGLDLEGGVSITYRVVGDFSASQLSDAIKMLEERAQLESSEAIVYQEGTDRINVEIPGVTNADEILASIGRPGKLYFIYETDEDGNANYNPSTYEMSKSIEELEAAGQIPLYGTDVADARGGTSNNSVTGLTQNVVDLTMTSEGRQKFSDATKRAYSKGETLAIYYDGAIISAPTVQGVLSDGRAQITGNFTAESADLLASRIRIGGLPVDLEELHSKVVGAQLGSDAVRTSLLAGAIGLGVVVIFMIVVYYLAGLAASLSLLLYTALVIFLLNGFEMTLTLPGIAGIILSIGMAVDANVIIFARIREELASGTSVKSAIKLGFDKALSAIIDGNVTTLIAAVVLWILGSGSIRGFAQTLVLGIVLSMFTSLVVTRLLINAFYTLGLKDAKWYGRAKSRKPIAFVKHKAVFFAISGVMIAAGIVFMIANKVSTGYSFNYSLDFIGGTSTSVVFNEEHPIADLEANIVPKIEAIANSSVQPQPVSGSNEVVFKSNALDQDKRSQISEMFENDYSVDPANITTETISSTISKETGRNTIIAVVIAIVCMLIYIRIRFRDLRFGIGGVAALLHDVLVVLAFYAMLKISVGSAFIACMLTIVGYSINATIVIFDRVRENRNLHPDMALDILINESVTQTLTRSIFTSLTTFIMVAALYVLGVTAIREFALPLAIGILCGTYSSICLAGPFYFVLRKLFPGKKGAVRLTDKAPKRDELDGQGA